MEDTIARMKVVIFGATGMIGQGVLRECLSAADVSHVLAVVRSPMGKTDPKLEELVHADFLDFAPVADRLAGYDACFWCLGISSVGMKEPEYTRITYDYTVAAAKVLAEKNPTMVFVFVSGANTDETEKSSTMWARVKGKAENAVAAMPFKSVYRFRPGYIQAGKGIVSKTPLYRAFYVLLSPFYPFWKLVAPGFVTRTESVGKAMLELARDGYDKPIIESREINALAARADARP